MSLIQLFKNIQKTGVRQWWRDLNYIGTTKAGQLIGTDQFGNKYWEDLDEIPGRHRWVEYSKHDFNGSQVPPEWAIWLNHNQELPPHVNPNVIKSRQAWTSDYLENITGTRAAFKTYSTTAPKIAAWIPQVAERKGSSSSPK